MCFNINILFLVPSGGKHGSPIENNSLNQILASQVWCLTGLVGQLIGFPAWPAFKDPKRLYNHQNKTAWLDWETSYRP